MGLLDWLNDGSLFGGGTESGMGGSASVLPQMGANRSMTPPPPVPAPTATPAAMPIPDMSGNMGRPFDPSTSDIGGGMQGAGPDPSTLGGQPGMDPALSPIPGAAGPTAPPPNPALAPMPGAEGPTAPSGLGASVPMPPATPVPAATPSAPMQIAPQGTATPADPTQITPAQVAAAGGGTTGAQPGFMSRFASAIGGGLGAGLTAAGNSAGKSPFQALTAGAGATMTGANEEEHKNTKDAQGYLTAAIAAKKANDDAGYKTNYVQYLLKESQEKAASKDAAANAASNKNDSDNQKYWAAQRDVASDRRDLGKQIIEMTKAGALPAEIAAAKATGEASIHARLQEHYAAAHIHPDTVANLDKQPGVSADNPVDAGAAGITSDNISKKLQAGQFYKNPKDGKIYQFKGKTPAVGSEAAPSRPSPADPMNPARGTLPAAEPAGAQ